MFRPLTARRDEKIQVLKGLISRSGAVDKISRAGVRAEFYQLFLIGVYLFSSYSEHDATTHKRTLMMTLGSNSELTTRTSKRDMI